MPNKTSYKYGEDIDVTGATIYVVKTSGIYTINVTKDMISGYSPNTSGNQSITVTYAGLKTNFIVYVEKKVVSEDTNNPETSVIPTKTTKNDRRISGTFHLFRRVAQPRGLWRGTVAQTPHRLVVGQPSIHSHCARNKHFAPFRHQLRHL